MRPPSLLNDSGNKDGEQPQKPLTEREVNGSNNKAHLLHHLHHETHDGVFSKYLVKSQFADNYDVEHDLGKGRFAVVRRCRCRITGSQFAAKVLRKARLHLTRDAILQEIFLHHRACRLHPRIARLMQVFEAPRDLVLVMEYAAGGELWQAIAHRRCGLHEPIVQRVIAQLLDILQHMHANGIIHCDINPHNILLTRPFYDHPDYQPDIRLCDFGLARSITTGQELRDIRGTLEYVAPEVLLFDPIGCYSDMWSVGVLAYVLLSGYSPFAGSTKEETLLNISRASVSSVDSEDDDALSGLFPPVSASGTSTSSDDDGEASDESVTCEEEDDANDSEDENRNWATPGARDFICRLLVRNHRLRPTAQECLRLPWLRDVEIPSTTTTTTTNDSSTVEKSP